MNPNPILEELYAIREQLLAEAGGDFQKFLEGLRDCEAASGRLLGQRKHATEFLLCVSNESYPASLEVRKVYQAAAASRGFVRVIDESGEDSLYPSDRFVAIELPQAAARVFAMES